MEFLIGRSLANNITNLLVEPLVREAMERERLDWRSWPRWSPTPAWATAAWAGWPPASSIRWPPCSSRPSATACATSTACSARRSRTAGRSSTPTTGCAVPTPGRSPGPREAVDVQLNCAFQLRDGRLEVVRDVPTILVGMPYDRPVVGYGGKTINTLRLWGARRARGLRLRGVQPRRLLRRRPREGRGRDADAGPLSRRFDAAAARACASSRSISWSPARWPTSCARFRRRGNDWHALPDKVAIQLNDTHPSLAVAELMRILLDQAQLGWDEAWDLTVRTLAYTNHTLLPEALEKWPVDLFEIVPAPASGDHLRDQPPLPGRRACPLSRRRGPRAHASA